MRTYVSTMGFHETRVTRPVLRHGLDDGDVVVLLRPDAEPDGDRGTEAVEYVEDMLHEIAPGASVETERVDHEDFAASVLQCSDVLTAADGELVVNFGGGAREVFLPLTVATINHASDVDRALQYTDVGQSVREWEVPNLAASVPDERRATLEAVAAAEESLSIPELQDRLDRSKSTVSRHVSALERDDLVETWTEGKTKVVAVRLAGRLHSGERD